MYVWRRSAVQVTKELKNSLGQFSLNTKALPRDVRSGKVSWQNTVMVQSFVSVSDHIILYNPNSPFLQFFTTVVLMKQESLDLLSWLAKESLDSNCIIYSSLKYSLFFCKIFRVCCSASWNTSPDRCETRFPSHSLSSDAETTLMISWVAMENKAQHKTLWAEQNCPHHHSFPVTQLSECKLGKQTWLHLPWAPARPTLQPCPWQC